MQELDLSSLFASAMKQASIEQAPPKRPLDVQARVLLDVLAERQRPCPFKVGDIIQQRRAFKRYKWPEVDADVAIVSQIPSEPFKAGEDSTHEMADMIILVQANEGWYEFPAESWRFESYTGPVA